jgi:hypothetical protein
MIGKRVELRVDPGWRVVKRGQVRSGDVVMVKTDHGDWWRAAGACIGTSVTTKWCAIRKVVGRRARR